jgi:hypothetical protein
MFSVEDFLASLTPLLADVADLTMSGISGQNTPDSFASLGLDGSWRKTCQGYSQVTLDGSLERFSETWPRAGMTRNGIAYQLPPSAPLTDEIASGLWPTPTEDGNYSRKGASAMSGDGLATAVRLWPKPQASDGSGSRQASAKKWASGAKIQWGLPQAIKWATPCARDFKAPGTRERLEKAMRESSRGQPLTEQVGGQLNPTWVEWLMGYPLGWTVCEAWETRSSRKSRNGSRTASKKRKP